jgi:hypothetical protein
VDEREADQRHAEEDGDGIDDPVEEIANHAL